MDEVTVNEKHTVSSMEMGQAAVEIYVSAQFPYKNVRGVEDVLYRFLDKLKMAGSGGKPPLSNGFVNGAYSDEEREVILGSTRENVWDRYHQAFPDSKRTRNGVVKSFLKWARFNKGEESGKGKGKKEEPVAAPLTSKEVGVVQNSVVILNAWQRKFILKHVTEEDIVKRFERKWPTVKLTPEMIQAIIADPWAPKKVKKPRDLSEVLKDQVKDLAEKGKSKFKVNDRVIQTGGLAPSVGVGTVTAISPDGKVTVKFIGSTKVLYENCFALSNGSGDGI
jgi:hypothetical protein